MKMQNQEFEFDLVFALPEGEHEHFDLADAVYCADLNDPIVGSFEDNRLAIALHEPGFDLDTVIRGTIPKLLKALPAGSSLHQIFLNEVEEYQLNADTVPLLA